MKEITKNTLIAIISLFISLACFGQLKVDQNGRIGIGTDLPNPQFKCHIKGNLLLSNYPETPTSELRQLVTVNGTYIGSNRDVVRFWSTNNDWNKVYAQAFLTFSDSSGKTNIEPLGSGISELMKIKPYSYNIQTSSIPKTYSEKKVYGFLSEEIAEAFPHLQITDTAEGVRLMDYNQIIPILVASTKEQQGIIDSLEDKISDLVAKVDALSKGRINDGDVRGQQLKTILYQNRPNPFQESTIIKYNIDAENFQSGSILIFDMNGALLKTYSASAGENELTINGRELKAGLYFYALIVNDREIDTKRMILMK
jgi:hypothetical protein